MAPKIPIIIPTIYIHIGTVAFLIASTTHIRIDCKLTSAPIGPYGAFCVFKAPIRKIRPKQLNTLPIDPRIQRLRSNSTAPVEKLTIPTI